MIELLLSAQIALVQRIADDVGCEAEIIPVITEEYGSYGDGEIWFDPRQSRKELIYTATHESYHCRLKDFMHPIFGKPPFVTKYAEKSPLEDIAESATALHFNGKPKTRKQRIIAQYLNVND